MIEIKNKKNCSGCSACKSICPKSAITMNFDNEGFSYPIIDKNKCIECNLCEKVCPMKKCKNKGDNSNEIYALKNLKQGVRKKSTSGGAFYSLAESMFKINGIVCAATFDSNMNVIHKIASSIDEIENMMGSKYVQSNINDCFIQIKNIINNKVPVLFVGTPCQVEGLISYIGNNEYLYTIDLYCYGVPSPRLYRKWLDYLENKYNDKIIKINFRDKKYGYYGSNTKVYFKSGRIIEDSMDSKSFLKTMFSHIGLRPSCYSCKFRNNKKNSDISIGDFWTIDQYIKKFGDFDGVTQVAVHSEKGKKLIDNIDEETVKCIKICNVCSNDNKNDIFIPKKRKNFFEDNEKLNYSELINKYFPYSKKDFVAYNVKPLVARIPGIKRLCKSLSNYKIKKQIINKK